MINSITFTSEKYSAVDVVICWPDCSVICIGCGVNSLSNGQD